MRRIAFLFFLVCLSLTFLVWNGCGSSRKTANESSAAGSGSEDEYDDIEKLLGISRDDNSGSQTSSQQTQQKTQPQEKKQDDLITLLEVDEGKKTDKPAGQTTGVEDKRVLRLQTEVDDLQKQLRQKDMEIANLKNQLATQKQTMQAQPSATPVDYSYTPPPRGTVSSDAYVNGYNDALSLFHERQYQNAIREFEQLLSTDMNHSYSDNAQYWIGESYYAMGRYQEAIMALI